MSHIREALTAAGLPVDPPKPSETWDCLKPRINVPQSRRGFRKLSDEQVLAIRKRYAAGGITQEKLAEEFGVSRVAIWDITSGRRHRYTGEAAA